MPFNVGDRVRVKTGGVCTEEAGKSGEVLIAEGITSTGTGILGAGQNISPLPLQTMYLVEIDGDRQAFILEECLELDR